MQWTVKCSKVNNGCDQPCASCTIRHLRGTNGLRWVICACGMSSQSSWITRHNCTMVSGGGPRDLFRAIIEVPRRWSVGCRTVSTLASAVYVLHLIYGSLCEAEWERMGHRYGRRARSVNRLRWLRMVCVNIQALWLLVFCNSSCGWSLLIP